jgi:hypothetical protein
MKTRHFSKIAILLLAFTASLRAAEPADALRALGAQVKEKDGAVTEISFRDCSKLGEAEFRLIGQCKALKSLTLYGSCAGLNDTTLPLLGGLAELESLSTDGTKLSDDGMKGFTALKNLHSLAMFHPSWDLKTFTGTGLAYLKELPKLERLTFAGSTAGDEALVAIGQITSLKDFSTWHTRQTQAGNAELLKLNLRSLRLGQRLPPRGDSPLSFDDATLATIAKMKSLETLTLMEARLSDAALTQIKALPNLKTLKIEQVDITPADIEALRAALPNVKVDYKPMEEQEKADLLDKKLHLPVR